MTDANKGQPIGSLVERSIKNGKFKVSSREIVPIEELKVGDYVSSYHFTDASVYARTLLNTTSLSYVGKLVNIKVGRDECRCLPTHKCIARYRDTSRDYCVYIMQRGDAFRVGMSKIWHDCNGCGPYKRLMDEGADKLWILKTFETRRDALLEECKISIKFRLPQAMFKFKEGRGSWTQKEFDHVWSEVSNIDDAKTAIEYYNRDIRYPYFNKSKKHTSIKRPHEVYACNLLENSEMMTRDKKWAGIELSTTEYYGMVYNLSVEKDDNYYSGGVLIHA